MKNQQKPLLSRGAIGSIFAIVALVTLSGYDIVPVPSKASELHKNVEEIAHTQPSMVLAWTLPSFSTSAAYAKTVNDSQNSDSLAMAFKPIVDPAASAPLIPELSDEDKVAKIRAYFGKYNLPLAQNAEKFVEVSHYCDIDWALLPAIGMRESTGGKFTQLNNPFGWASARIGFKDFDEAIEVVGGHLCGLYDSTDQYYKDKTTAQKLWYYNGSVNRRYTGEVIAIMNKIKTTPLETSLAMK